MIHYFYGTLQVGIGQTLCSFEHVSCLLILFKSRNISENYPFTAVKNFTVPVHRKWTVTLLLHITQLKRQKIKEHPLIVM